MTSETQVLKIAHIVNPVIVKETSDLFVAQPITFKTMKVAQDFAKGFGIDVQLFTAQYPEDHDIIPDYFHKTCDLERSIIDVGKFKVPRKLPLLRDILNRLYDVSNADYFIYTNVDIALMPNFYVSVNKIIDLGYDSFVINRRLISIKHESVDDIPLMYGEIGEPHQGYDCFVFKRDNYPQYSLGDICIGIKFIDSTFLTNLICYSKKFNVFKDKHLTFHIDDKRTWALPDNYDYLVHNRTEFLKIARQLKEKNGNLAGDEVVRDLLSDADDSIEKSKPSVKAAIVWNIKKRARDFLFSNETLKRIRSKIRKSKKSDF